MTDSPYVIAGPDDHDPSQTPSPHLPMNTTIISRWHRSLITW